MTDVITESTWRSLQHIANQLTVYAVTTTNPQAKSALEESAAILNDAATNLQTNMRETLHLTHT